MSHVMSALGQVQENSPAQQAGLEPYFDFIITIGHSRLVRLPFALCPTGRPCLPLLLFLFWVDQGHRGTLGGGHKA